VLVSDDSGETWSEVAALDLIWPALFTHGEDLYLLGCRRGPREIAIAHSRDSGEVWSDEATLFEGRHHKAPTAVLRKDGFAYAALETCPDHHRSHWKSLVIAGDLSGDLLDPAAWRMSNKISFPGIPDTLTQKKWPASIEDKVPEDSWLEANVIKVRGEIRVMLRTIIDGHSTSGLASVCRLKDDGEGLQHEFLQFYPMPGAQCKFHIVFDDESGLFWTTVCLPTDPWQDREPLRQLGFSGPPGNERRILVLMYSLDALNWFQAGCVAISRNPMESFSYASNLVHGEELLVLSRTSQEGLNQHDTNLITLHRVEQFRELALDLRPVSPKAGPDSGRGR